LCRGSLLPRLPIANSNRYLHSIYSYRNCETLYFVITTVGDEVDPTFPQKVVYLQPEPLEL
jgi:hypothetical protein